MNEETSSILAQSLNSRSRYRQLTYRLKLVSIPFSKFACISQSTHPFWESILMAGVLASLLFSPVRAVQVQSSSLDCENVLGQQRFRTAREVCAESQVI